MMFVPINHVGSDLECKFMDPKSRTYEWKKNIYPFEPMSWNTELVPVVPHKAVAEVSKREVGCCESRMAERTH